MDKTFLFLMEDVYINEKASNKEMHSHSRRSALGNLNYLR